MDSEKELVPYWYRLANTAYNVLVLTKFNRAKIRSVTFGTMTSGEVACSMTLAKNVARDKGIDRCIAPRTKR